MSQRTDHEVRVPDPPRQQDQADRDQAEKSRGAVAHSISGSSMIRRRKMQFLHDPAKKCVGSWKKNSLMGAFSRVGSPDGSAAGGCLGQFGCKQSPKWLFVLDTTGLFTRLAWTLILA